MNITNKPAAPIILYGFKLSGHCHRVELFMSLIGVPYRYVDVDLRNGAHKQPDFIKMNCFGQVPVIDDAGTILTDSNAIMIYLAVRYGPLSWYSHDAVKQAGIQRWLSTAAGLLAFGPAMARAITVFKRNEDTRDAVERATRLFTVMDKELEHSAFLVGDQPTVADIALYSYTARAPEGKISLEPFANIGQWLSRIEALPGFIAMPNFPT
jgi:glutathione S-transferase